MSEEDEILESLKGLRDQILNSLERYWIFSVPYSLGEVAIVAAFSRAFKLTHGGNLALLVDPAKLGVLQMFSDYLDGAIQVPIRILRELRTRGLLGPETFKPGVIQDVYVLHDAKLDLLALSELRGQRPDRGLPLMDLFRFAMRLPWDASVQLGRPGPEAVEQANRISREVGIEPGNSVILFLGNNTNRPAPSAFWRRVASEAMNRGKRVFINISGAAFLPEDLNIPGTRIELTDVPTAIAVCDIAGQMVAGSNGFVATSLLTATTFGLDVILTDSFDPTGTGQGFRPMHPQAGSLFKHAPELLEGASRPYREWEVTDAAEMDAVALRLVDAWRTSGAPSE